MKRTLVFLLLFAFPLAPFPARGAGKLIGRLTVFAPSGLHLREKPDLRSKSIIIVPYAAVVHAGEEAGDVFTIDGYLGRWIRAEYKGFAGYIFRGYLSRLPAPRTIDEFTSIEQYCSAFCVRDGIEKTCLTKEMKKDPDARCTIRACKGGFIWREEVSSESGASETLTVSDLTLQEGFLLLRALAGKDWSPYPKFDFPIKNMKYNVNHLPVEIKKTPTLIEIHYYQSIYWVQRLDKGSVQIGYTSND